MHLRKKLRSAFYIVPILYLLYIFNPAYTAYAGLPDTGQTQCYDNSKEIPCPKPWQPFYGQDGNYRGPQPAYQVSADGLVVTDLNTGLMWERAHDQESKKGWSAAVSYCERLALSGYSDWRIPSRQELVSIIDYGRFSPTINSVVFSCPNYNYWTPVNCNLDFWSGDTYADNQDWAWYVDFQQGSASTNGKANINYFVRCVRGSPYMSSGTYVNNDDGTVTATATGLMWQQADDGLARTWQNAIDYCESQELAGKTDWRLPDIRELQSIVDEKRYSPAVNPAFSCQEGLGNYWSGSVWANYPENAWQVDSLEGATHAAPKNNTVWQNFVRCVRGGPSGLFRSARSAQWNVLLLLKE